MLLAQCDWDENLDFLWIISQQQIHNDESEKIVGIFQWFIGIIQLVALFLVFVRERFLNHSLRLNYSHLWSEVETWILGLFKVKFVCFNIHKIMKLLIIEAGHWRCFNFTQSSTKDASWKIFYSIFSFCEWQYYSYHVFQQNFLCWVSLIFFMSCLSVILFQTF